MNFERLPSNTTAEDLIRDYRFCGDALVETLCEHLDDQVDLLREVEEENRKLSDGLDGLAEEPCPECERLELQLDSFADKVADLEEQVAHERSRIAEFHDENKQLRAEIARMKKEKVRA